MGIHCLNCGRYFEPEVTGQFWCSMTCAVEYNKKPIFSSEEIQEIKKIVKQELEKLK